MARSMSASWRSAWSMDSFRFSVSSFRFSWSSELPPLTIGSSWPSKSMASSSRLWTLSRIFSRSCRCSFRSSIASSSMAMVLVMMTEARDGAVLYVIKSVAVSYGHVFRAESLPVAVARWTMAVLMFCSSFLRVASSSRSFVSCYMNHGQGSVPFAA
ncbi:uncharacterized protein F5Z01DRAFT_140102 [Emericellopsis atlantica]|uniref:Uncharacterized protein n=1 Tax=Emericellopsis atlantica TaxID=2614577 RepID=A0A9P8CNV6_9HYPO|nr:uncharacterized protein F5Z01DRAFT_140102 [Emericellopsis atlantica]KAG9253485.1 hypothetical protein F5Z01DRAFT_140102 [Emericellopsis atlantica]